MRALRRVRAFFAFPSEFYNGFANSPTPFILNKKENASFSNQLTYGMLNTLSNNFFYKFLLIHSYFCREIFKTHSIFWYFQPTLRDRDIFSRYNIFFIG